jgi:hypothetical protein
MTAFARRTFVVQIHADGVATLENLDTRERVPIAELTDVGPRIERWLSEAVGAEQTAPGEEGRPRACGPRATR